MSIEENKTLLRYYYEEVVSQGAEDEVPRFDDRADGSMASRIRGNLRG